MRLTKVRHGKLNRQNRNKMGEDRQRKLTANHQQIKNCIKQLIGQEWNSARFSDPNNTRRKQLMMIMSFSPFAFCWKIDHFRSKWRFARYKTTLKTLEIWILPRVSNLVFLCSVDFCFSPFFFRTCFYFVFFWFVSFFLTVIYNWEALSFFQRPTANIIKKAYNATE